MANTTTITSRGQVTVPRDIRKRMGLKPGHKLVFSLLSDGTLVARPKRRQIADLAGILHKPGQAMTSIAEMKVDLSDEG